MCLPRSQVSQHYVFASRSVRMAKYYQILAKQRAMMHRVVAESTQGTGRQQVALLWPLSALLWASDVPFLSL